MGRARKLAVAAAAAGLALVVACGAPPAPAPPPPATRAAIDPRALAAELDQQLGELAAIVHAHRADCPRLAAELRDLFARMAISVQRAREAQQDAELARQLTAALRAYDRSSAERTAAIEADFAADPSCTYDPEVRKVLEAMPIL